MSTFHDFLVWFDGWQENIDAQPNAKQWDRLRAKIAEVRETAGSEPQTTEVASAPAAPKVPPIEQLKPTTKQQWRSVFLGALCELGYDLESAEDVWADYDRDHPNIDLGQSAIAAAKAAHAGSAN